jgi:hypothetical protein
METITLALGLAKIAAEIFQDERRGRFLNELGKLEKEWNEEMDKSLDDRSDLAIDRIMRDSNAIYRRIIAEAKDLARG